MNFEREIIKPHEGETDMKAQVLEILEIEETTREECLENPEAYRVERTRVLDALRELITTTKNPVELENEILAVLKSNELFTTEGKIDPHIVSALARDFLPVYYKLCKEGDGETGKQRIISIIEETDDVLSSVGRIEEYQRNFREKYKGKRAKLLDMPKYRGLLDNNITLKELKHAMYAGRIDEVREWLKEARENPAEFISGVKEEQRDAVLNDRERELKLFERLDEIQKNGPSGPDELLFLSKFGLFELDDEIEKAIEANS